MQTNNQTRSSDSNVSYTFVTPTAGSAELYEVVEGEIVKDINGELHVKSYAVLDPKRYYFGEKVNLKIIKRICTSTGTGSN